MRRLILEVRSDWRGWLGVRGWEGGSVLGGKSQRQRCIHRLIFQNIPGPHTRSSSRTRNDGEERPVASTLRFCLHSRPPSRRCTWGQVPICTALLWKGRSRGTTEPSLSWGLALQPSSFGAGRPFLQSAWPPHGSWPPQLRPLMEPCRGDLGLKCSPLLRGRDQGGTPRAAGEALERPALRGGSSGWLLWAAGGTDGILQRRRAVL